MSFDTHLTQERRLTLLRALESAAQYSVNALMLKSFCASVGYSVSSDRIEQDLAWLQEQGLVVLTKPTEALTVATLTVRGLDVASGRARVPGVAAPQPGA